jgi:tryptophan-rich sensory protein
MMADEVLARDCACAVELPTASRPTGCFQPRQRRIAITLPLLNEMNRNALAFAGWLTLCLAASGTAFFVSTAGWYAGLAKPPWNPPPWVFAPVWTTLYIMMAAAAWLVWREGGWVMQGRPLGLFLLQWVLNALWTPIFFAMHRTGLAFVEIAVLWLVLAATLASFWRVRAAAGALLLPYLAWVSFAAALNFAIWRLNR